MAGEKAGSGLFPQGAEVIIQGGSKKTEVSNINYYSVLLEQGVTGRSLRSSSPEKMCLHNMKEEITRFESRRKKITFGRRRENNNKNSEIKNQMFNV